MMNIEKITARREVMKGYSQADLNSDSISDEKAGLPQPPINKVCGGEKVIPLTKDFDGLLRNNSFLSLLTSRTSRRSYSDHPLSLDELAFLLWATQGVKLVGKSRRATLRTVPSGGARHALECYVFVNNVTGLEQGIYHYLALEHSLEFLGGLEHQAECLTEAFGGQAFFGSASACFVYTAVPYRMEWRYNEKAQKNTLLEAGHACQNLYLACEALGLGTCAIGEYHQEEADALLGLDTASSSPYDSEFVVYAASVGKPKED
jgi:SagB-type dehydrogenase family enzyme